MPGQTTASETASNTLFEYPKQNLEKDAETITLTVSAAASLQPALTQIQPLFALEHPNIDIFYNWGGSGTLQRQIEQGAPADIFFPASTQQMDALNRRGLILPDSRQSLLGNQLVLITGPNSGNIKTLGDLKRLSRPIAVGDFQSVPVGQYAEATLAHEQLLTKLRSQLVFFNSVRGVLSAVENGHAAAAFVYATDAQLSPQVQVAAIAAPITHPPIDYPIAILQRSAHPEAAQQYIDFLNSAIATQTFQRFGFEAR